MQSYRYDPLYRLTEARETTGTTQNWIQNWNYDRYGNRNWFTQSFAGSTNPTVPTVDQSRNRFDTGQGFVYDKNGNVVQDTDPITSLNRTFVFNGDNKQITVKDSNGNDIGQYFYDGEGKRVKKVIPATGETTVFVYSSGKLIAEYSTQTNPNPSINYTTTDHLGSPRIITDQFGQVKSRRDFMPFGEEIDAGIGARSAALSYNSATDSLRQKFTGYQKDNETSLDYAEARMYENRYGRFTAVDPLLASAKFSNPQSFNRYTYVYNTPLKRVDPSGQNPGDYYDRQGNYIGNDGIDDKLVWIADVTKRDETNHVVYVDNAVQTTIFRVRVMQGAAAAAELGATPNNDFTSILGRAQFYGAFHANFSSGTTWSGNASKVAEDVDMLTWPSSRWLGYSNDELAEFANRGNKTIFDDALPKLALLRNGGQLQPDAGFRWDGTTLAQEQNLIQPLYESLSRGSADLLQNDVKHNFFFSFLARSNSPAFPRDRDLMNVQHRWEFGMKLMGYSNVTPDQMPDPGVQYRTPEMYNRLNPDKPLGPIVVRVRF